jgi:eukaryotic-like serine/threonine-protein kinase
MRSAESFRRLERYADLAPSSFCPASPCARATMLLSGRLLLPVLGSAALTVDSRALASKLVAAAERRAGGFEANEAMTPEVGQIVGQRYALERLLDRGGMGAVWVARDIQTEAVVAVKVLHALAHPPALRRFRREAAALERLAHPNVVRIVAHGVDASAPFIAMELLHGENLRSLLQRQGTLSLRRALDITRQAASGLAAAHALGIVHRDIKPSNLFLCDSAGAARVKVVDFGIAIGELLEADSQSTGTGFIGSPAYMSPEQARAETVDAHADIWSLSVVAFQMLTGREPFNGANVPETLQRICSGQAPLPSQVARGLPARLDDVFARAFAANRQARFPNLSRLLEALEAAVAGVPDVTAISLAPSPAAGRTAVTVSYTPSAAQPTVRAKESSRWRRAAPLLLGATAALLLSRAAACGLQTATPQAVVKAASAPLPLRLPRAVAADSPAPPVEPSPQTVAAAGSAPPKSRPLAGARTTERGHDSSPTPSAPNSVAAVVPSIAVSVDPVFGLRVSSPNAPQKPNPGDVVADGTAQHVSARSR